MVRRVLIVLLVLVLIGGGYIAFNYQSFIDGITHVNALVPGGVSSGKAQNILLVGDDSRPANASQAVLQQLSTQEDGGSVNTDTIMLVHIPAGGGQATVVSFPRDSWIDIPGHGKGKINSAFAIGSSKGGGDQGGMKLLLQVVENLSGLHVDHFVKVSLLGFYQIAQVLGPLQVCLNQPAKDSYSGVDLPAGVSTLNAKQAAKLNVPLDPQLLLCLSLRHQSPHPMPASSTRKPLRRRRSIPLRQTRYSEVISKRRPCLTPTPRTPRLPQSRPQMAYPSPKDSKPKEPSASLALASVIT